MDLCTARTEAERRKGAMMRGPLIQTEARTILNRGISQGINQGISQGRNQGKKEIALRMLKMGKLSVGEIAEYSALSVAEVKQLAKLHTVQERQQLD